MEERSWLQSMGSQRVEHNEWLHFTLHFRDIYQRRKWQPTPVSCLENPMDGGTWQAIGHSVSKSWTWLSDITSLHFTSETYMRIDAFELWCWRKLLRVPWTTRSILKEISPEYSLEGLMLKLQYFGHLMRRTNSLEKTLILGKIEGRRRRRWQDEMIGWHHWLNGHEFELALGVGDGQGALGCCSLWGHKELDTTEWLN